MSTTLAELRALPHLSVSQMRTFTMCPRRYRLQYIDDVDPAFRTSALVFGSAFHEAIEEHLLNVTRHEPASREQLHAVFRDAMARQLAANGPVVLFDDGEDPARLLAMGMDMIDAFLLRVAPPEEVRAVELPFAIELVDAETGEVLPVPLIGAIDALVVTQGRATVWELKTGRRRWTTDQIQFDLQPTAYRLAAIREGIEDPQVELLLVTKSGRPDVQRERLVRGQADERDLFATAASMLRAIQAGVDHPSRGWQCRSCPMAGACR